MWEHFKSHTISIDDSELNTRLPPLITGYTNTFAAERRYYPACLRTYISNTKDEVEELPYQNVQVQEVKQLLFNHVKNVNFEENEQRTLKGLLEDYNKMLENCNFKRCERTSLLKEMSQKEFGQSIGFHNCFQKNQSCIVFDVSKGGTYIEAAINFWGISEDEKCGQNTQRKSKEIFKYGMATTSSLSIRKTVHSS